MCDLTATRDTKIEQIESPTAKESTPQLQHPSLWSDQPEKARSILGVLGVLATGPHDSHLFMHHVQYVCRTQKIQCPVRLASFSQVPAVLCCHCTTASMILSKSSPPVQSSMTRYKWRPCRAVRCEFLISAPLAIYLENKGLRCPSFTNNERATWFMCFATNFRQEQPR